jgi:hypothetical protein
VLEDNGIEFAKEIEDVEEVVREIKQLHENVSPQDF